MADTPTAPPTAPGDGSTSVPTAAPTVAVPAIQEFADSSLVVTIAFACACAAIVIAGFNIFRHLVNYSEPKLQKNIVRILFMVPFYAAFSFLALAFENGHIFFDSVRDIYEAFVVYCFLNLMLLYCGGENACLSVIMNDPGTISHPCPLSYCLPDMALTARFLRGCKQGTLQFVIIKPIMAILNLILVAVHDKDENLPVWNIIQTVVYNVSYTLALYALMLFYKATKHHPGLKDQHPILKFLSVKLVVFATYYQSLLVFFVPGASTHSKERLNNFILCCEMVLFAFLQYWAFPWKEFSEKNLKKRGHVTQRNDSDFDSIGIEVQDNPRMGGSAGPSPTSGDNEIALSNAKDVMSIHDVAKDAYYNFNNKYGEHVLLDSSGTMNRIGSENGDDDADEYVDEHGVKTMKRNYTPPDTEANPFGSATMGGFGAPKADGGYPGSEPGFDMGHHDLTPPISARSTDDEVYDPRLPSYLPENEIMNSDNPFAAEVQDPLGLAEDENDMPVAPLNDDDDWMPDFNESTAEVSAKQKKKKKKTKRTPKQNNSEKNKTEEFTELDLS
uniref:Uncharacterized protein n=1 Tax=Mucochytrium quahogii TaxID=96639 RepID=A0A7S2WPU8_9STRA|mmetsp:Transcript_4681/g.7026  ORF Transcript_4681/g.7026 Transcript_4681/m.7026 type:complete len:558 (-) Transcript_4681:317-1990(-)|eukprot:CAMPEP_0203762982 /NCGR_PEP_ID=MMETSP0098-20131031/15729_1 /ASSEMBLY_ACC=CAM_ASM_000208 /TAXON_ID=96639 /ORGANISM=" , Strain NY0313808BC1" /LENGTH=557 /DNA_ID=CAMNT_0050657585 /DNA_START=284 /DNA_END=1957 /DNA_ORIENTATION=-